MATLQTNRNGSMSQTIFYPWFGITVFIGLAVVMTKRDHKLAIASI
jgi:hypothetical protein